MNERDERRRQGRQISEFTCLNAAIFFDESWLRVVLLDMNAAGMGVYVQGSSCPYAVGADITLRLRLNESEEIFELSGEVRHIKPLVHGYRLGLQFEYYGSLFRHLTSDHASLHSIIDQRKVRRLGVHRPFDVEVIVEGSSGNERVYRGSIFDQSIYGMSVALKRPGRGALETGERVTLRFALDELPTVNVVARLAHLTPIGSRQILWGFEFDREETLDFPRVESILARYSLKYGICKSNP